MINSSNISLDSLLLSSYTVCHVMECPESDYKSKTGLEKGFTVVVTHALNFEWWAGVHQLEIT